MALTESVSEVQAESRSAQSKGAADVTSLKAQLDRAEASVTKLSEYVHSSVFTKCIVDQLKEALAHGGVAERASSMAEEPQTAAS
eukprot:7119751-Pyramimonas_sp.AAC.1